MLKNKIIVEVSEPMTSTDIMKALDKAVSEDKDLQVQNPFTSGEQFEDGEKVVFKGFNLKGWEEDGEGDARNKRNKGKHGCYIVVEFEDGKTLSLKTPTKRKVGRLLDPNSPNNGEFGQYLNEGGLATVLRSINSEKVGKADLDKVAKWFSTNTHTIALRWIWDERGYATSLVNVL